MATSCLPLALSWPCIHFLSCPFSFSLITVCSCAVHCSRPFHLARAHALKVSLTSPCLQSCVERFLCHTFSNKPLSRRHQANRPSPGLPLSLPSTEPSRRNPYLPLFNRAKPPDSLSQLNPRALTEAVQLQPPNTGDQPTSNSATLTPPATPQNFKFFNNFLK